MNYQCPYCRRTENIADELIPDGGKTIQCSGCGHPNVVSKPLPVIPGPEERICSGCNSLIHKSKRICPVCGQRTPAYKSRTTAAIFALLLGGIGVHKFYLGNISWGIIYILFSWTYIPLIASLIEGIMYLVQQDDEWDLKYNIN
jgi:TM2 domain-containing membrane protein YozV